MEQVAPVGKHRSHEQLAGGVTPDLEGSHVTVDDDRAPVHIAVNVFDTANGHDREMPNRSFPLRAGARAEAHRKIPVGNAGFSPASTGSKRKRCGPEDAVHRPVELAQAAEPRGKRYVSHGKIR